MKAAPHLRGLAYEGQHRAAASSSAPEAAPVGLRRLFVLVVLQLFPFALMVVALPALLLDACGGSAHKAAHYVTLGDSLFFGLQWACAGAWGGFSDRVGRKPLLLVGIAADALGSIVLAAAPLRLLPDIYLALAVARGIFAQARIGLFAAVADVSPRDSSLARNFGFFGVAFGLCFVTAPAAGAVLYSVSPRLPLYVAVAFKVSAAVVAVATPETLPAAAASRKSRGDCLERASPIAPVRVVCAAPLVAETLPSYVLASTASATYSLSVYFLKRRFSASVQTIGIFLSCVGLAICVCQGAVLPALSPRVLDDRGSCLLGFAAIAAYFAAFGLAPSVEYVFASLVFVLFSGLYDPCLRAIMATALEGNVGALSGALASLSSASHVVSFAFGALFVAGSKGGVPGAPYFVASALCCAAGGLALRAFLRHPPQVKDAPPRAVELAVPRKESSSGLA